MDSAGKADRPKEDHVTEPWARPTLSVGLRMTIHPGRQRRGSWGSRNKAKEGRAVTK